MLPCFDYRATLTRTHFRTLAQLSHPPSGGGLIEFRIRFLAAAFLSAAPGLLFPETNSSSELIQRTLLGSHLSGDGPQSFSPSEVCSESGIRHLRPTESPISAIGHHTGWSRLHSRMDRLPTLCLSNILGFSFSIDSPDWFFGLCFRLWTHGF